VNGFRVRVHPRVGRELEAIERAGRPDIVRRIQRSLEDLEREPLRPRPGVDVKKVKGAPDPLHRLRVGPYRLLFRVETASREILVLRVYRKG